MSHININVLTEICLIGSFVGSQKIYYMYITYIQCRAMHMAVVLLLYCCHTQYEYINSD